MKILFSVFAMVLALCLTPISAHADCPKDCDSTCCTKGPFGTKVCDPTGTCQATCSLYNTTCGQPSLPVPGPILPPNVGPTVPINIPPVPKDVVVALLTGGMVNPVTVKATNDVIQNVGKALKDIEKTSAKALDDTHNEAGRAARQIGTAVEAMAEYSKAETVGTVENARHALGRVREGKIVDALWSLGTEDLQNKDNAASSAAMKSDIIRTVGSVASTVYGGPGGAAAYAAWLTYHQSGGDVNLALKVGIIAGATSWAMASTQALPVQDASGNIIASDLAKKVAISGAIGGLAVAAAGGDEDAVRKGFLQAGAMVLIQEGYHSYTKHPMSDEQLRTSKGNPYCLSATVNCQEPPADAYVYDKNGKFIGWDQTKLDAPAPHVGTGYPNTPIRPGDVTWPTEGSPFMTGVSKIPGSNAMAVFHDQWAVDWNMSPGVLQTTIYPSIVLTYNGTTAPLLETVRVTALGNAKKEAASHNLAHPVIYRDDTAKVPIKKEQVETAYVCAGNTLTRAITVEVNPKKRDFACRVIYRASSKRTIPWLAMNDLTYCEAKARSLANVQLGAKFSCMVASATSTTTNGSVSLSK